MQQISTADKEREVLQESRTAAIVTTQVGHTEKSKIDMPIVREIIDQMIKAYRSWKYCSLGAYL